MKYLQPRDFESWQEYYFQYQFNLARDYYIPLLAVWDVKIRGKKVLDIGCGNGGFTSAFAQAGAACTGVEIRKIPWKGDSENPRFLVQDITASDAGKNLDAPFDLVILRDVIEHIPLDRKLDFLSAAKKLIHENSQILVTFPPFYSPFGLHQQTLLKKGSRKIPFLGWIPGWLLNPILKWIGETEKDILGVKNIRQCRMTVSGFNSLAEQTGFHISQERYFHIRPSHEIRYGWKTRESALGRVPVIREIVNLGTVYLLTNRHAARRMERDHDAL